jgi:hypothetical protein
LEILIFAEGGKPENPEKNPRSHNEQTTQLTYDTEPGIEPSLGHSDEERALKNTNSF